MWTFKILLALFKRLKMYIVTKCIYIVPLLCQLWLLCFVNLRSEIIPVERQRFGQTLVSEISGNLSEQEADVPRRISK